jgi:mevalonate kinase
MVVQATAPGKLILCGEHAVVYGAPALLTAVDRTAHAVLEPTDDGCFRFTAPALESAQRYTAVELTDLVDTLDDRYAAFSRGERPITKVLADPLQLVAYAFGRYLAHPDAQRPNGAGLTLTVDIPLGAGMGSSAAVVLCVLRAAAAICGVEPSAADLFALAVACERLRHGRPSGADPYCCLHGGLIRFQRDTAAVHLDPVPLVCSLVHSGQPQVSTGECVALVRQKVRDPGIWAEFTAVADAVQQALVAGDCDRLQTAVAHNHRLLLRLGVVPAPVAAFVAAVEAAGGAAKISGAGAVRGPAGGSVLVFGDVDAAALAAPFNYPCEPVRGVTDGTRLL